MITISLQDNTAYYWCDISGRDSADFGTSMAFLKTPDLNGSTSDVISFDLFLTVGKNEPAVTFNNVRWLDLEMPNFMEEGTHIISFLSYNHGGSWVAGDKGLHPQYSIVLNGEIPAQITEPTFSYNVGVKKYAILALNDENVTNPERLSSVGFTLALTVRSGSSVSFKDVVWYSSNSWASELSSPPDFSVGGTFNISFVKNGAVWKAALN